MGAIVRRLIRINPMIIEMQYHETQSNNYAILIPPSPNKGGTMRNSIISLMFKAFIDCNWNVLRFNFRNCGESKGPVNNDEHTYLTDANIILDWYLDQIHADKDHFFIGGYAFGAKIALETLMRRPELNGFITVSPPVHECDFSFLTPCTYPGLIAHAKYDEFATMQQITTLYDKIHSQQPTSQLHVFNDTHKFRNSKQDLMDAIRSYIKQQEQIKVKSPFELSFGQDDVFDM